MENMPGAWPTGPKLSALTPPPSPELTASTLPQSPELTSSTHPQLIESSFIASQSEFPSHMRSISSSRCSKRKQSSGRSLSRILAVQQQRNHLKQLLSDQNKQLNSHKRELQVASFKMYKKDAMMVKLKEDKLVLERRIEQQAAEHAERADKLVIAEFRAEMFQATDKKGEDKLICKLREEANAQCLRANNAEAHVRQLEHDLTQATSELHQGYDARNELQLLQQKLDTSVTNSQKSAYEIEELQKALEASNNHAIDIKQQAVAHIQHIEEAASQDRQRLIELGTEAEARVNKAEFANRRLQHTNAKQATEIKNLQREAQKWKDLAEDRGRATVAVSELEGKLAEKTRQLEGHNTRANDAEAKVKELERQVHNLQTDMTQLEEAAGNTSNNEADVTLTNQAERLERELAANIELLEELIVSSGMDTACRDVLQSVVFTNQCFRSMEEELEDSHAANVEALNGILEDADPNLDGLKLIENTERPVLVRQLEEVHSMKKGIDQILEDAELLGQVYLDEEDTEKIKGILMRPRTQDAAAALISPTSPPRSPSRSPSPPASPPPPASQPNISSHAPLYNPPRPQQPTLAAPLYLPGLHLTNPTASPTTGAPPPFNPLWDTLQPAAPTSPAPSALGSSLLPLLNDLPQATSAGAASSSDSDSDSDDDVLPEAFEGQYDEESSDEDEAPRAPPVGQRPIRQPRSLLRRRRSEDPETAVFM